MRSRSSGVSDGVLLDFRHRGDEERITPEDISGKLEEIKYEIKPLDIVLIQTGADSAWGTARIPVKGAGMTAHPLSFGKGVKVCWDDALG